MKIATVSLAVLGFGLMGLASTPAAAQGTKNTQTKPSYTNICPNFWRSVGNTCVWNSPGVAIYATPRATDACASGYIRQVSWCVVGSNSAYTESSTAGPFRKANALDRCPVSYFTNPDDGNQCITQAASPPRVRSKGSAPCRTGEIDDWGLYCVSNYASLPRGDAVKGLMDYNVIYSVSYGLTGRQQEPAQANLPEGVFYTPAYFTIFGRVDVNGAPLAGGSAPAVQAVSNPASSQTANTQAAPAPAAPNCPTPSTGNAGTGAQLGSQLGGLLGGRRGNSQAGAALGGLLGAAAGAVKPAGCP